MSAFVLAVLLSFVPGASAERPAQDDMQRVQELLQRAEQENKAGRPAQARRHLAEAWALLADVYYKQGNRTASDQAFRTARRYGWTGPSPAEKAKPKPAPPAPKPPPPAPKPPQEQPPPRVQPTPRQPRPSTPDSELWKRFSLSPYRSPRAGGWHGLLNTPAFEAASVLPRGRHRFGLVLDLATTDYSDGSGVTTTIWHTAMTTASLEYEYGFTDQIEIGGRLEFGELAEVDDDIVVFDGVNQIIPSGERDMGLSSLVLRGKWVTPTDFAELGALLEFKIPLADEANYLTAQTFDIGLSGLLTKTWESWSLHVNVGVVYPFGDADLFTTDADLDPYFHGGLGVGLQVFDSLTLLIQAEFNTSAFGEIPALDAPVTVASLGGRYRLSDVLFLSGAVGFGLGEESGDLLFSTGLGYYF